AEDGIRDRNVTGVQTCALPILVERARRLAAARHYTAAERDLQRALRNDPVHADALAAFGVVLSRKGLWSEAVPFLRRVVEAEPRSEERRVGKEGRSRWSAEE